MVKFLFALCFAFPAWWLVSDDPNYKVPILAGILGGLGGLWLIGRLERAWIASYPPATPPPDHDQYPEAPRQLPCPPARLSEGNS